MLPMNDELEDIVFEESGVQAIYRTSAGFDLRSVDKPVVSEISLKIYVNGQELVSLLCLNQQHVELALGFLYNEGVINSFAEVKETGYNPSAHVVNVRLSDGVSVSRQESLRSITAGCGKCFTYINPLRQSQFRKIVGNRRFSLAQIMRRMADFTQKSGLYKGMGGVHSLLLQAPGRAVFSEDIGRHNCLDKVTGTMLKEGRLSSAKDAVVYISGRVTSEIMTKLIRLGAPVIVSKSTPSVAAIKLAEQYGVTLLGYVKGDSGFVYSGADRLLVDPLPGSNAEAHTSAPARPELMGALANVSTPIR
jgi:FdhD protein